MKIKYRNKIYFLKIKNIKNSINRYYNLHTFLIEKYHNKKHNFISIKYSEYDLELINLLCKICVNYKICDDLIKIDKRLITFIPNELKTLKHYENI